MTTDLHAGKLRKLVGGAGFTITKTSPSRYLISSKQGPQVAVADARGFRAVFADT